MKALKTIDGIKFTFSMKRKKMGFAQKVCCFCALSNIYSKAFNTHKNEWKMPILTMGASKTHFIVIWLCIVSEIEFYCSLLIHFKGTHISD